MRRRTRKRVGVRRRRVGISSASREARTVGVALVELRTALLASLGKEPELLRAFQVAARPPAGERRQVVRADRRKRVARVRRRRLEFAALVALEIEHAIRQHAARASAGASSSGTVPRSSPITMQRLRSLSSASDREQSVER